VIALYCPKINVTHRATGWAMHPKEVMSSAQCRGDRRSEKHRHAPRPRVVPGRDQSAGVLRHQGVRKFCSVLRERAALFVNFTAVHQRIVAE
jgi:hypothetical protein